MSDAVLQAPKQMETQSPCNGIDSDPEDPEEPNFAGFESPKKSRNSETGHSKNYLMIHMSQIIDMVQILP